jgi:5'-nucleotidase
MRILIANDDGFRAPGILALHAELSNIAECTVVAPDRDRSGASNSLTLTRPLRAHQQDNGFIAVEGTPTDCVHLAINGFLDEPPDMVVSGVNSGANMGDDVHYSGTVAAAMEGRFLGLPAIAVSLAGQGPLRHYACAARIARELIEGLAGRRQPASIVNVNVPDLPYEQLAGWRTTRLGNRHKSEPVIVAHDPRGRECYWIGAPGPEQDAGEGTDFHAVARGFVSLTPLAADMTRYDALDDMSDWIQACGQR